MRTPPAAFTIPGMAQRLEEAAGRWRAAEQRLYPIVILWPEGYERYLSLIRAVADELRSIRTAEGLADAYAGGVELASSVALREALPTEGLELELAMGAACCLRYREVCAEMRREEAARRVGEARAQRREWVMVDEPRPWQDAVIPPYRRMDMHLPEGTGFHVWVEQSPDQAGLEYGVEVVQLDPTTGEWLAQDPVLERRTFSERGAWEEAVEALKARWEGPEAQP